MKIERYALPLLCTALIAAASGGARAAGAPQVPAGWTLYTTAEGAGERFAARTLDAPRAASQPLETDIAVFVDSRRRFQEVLGFGGAITDATAETYARLAPDQQRAFLDAYFDPRQGLGYTLLRTTIHSSDFSSASYTYVADGDRALATFSIAHDLQYRVPLLRQALAAASAGGSAVRVFASPWSAPGWMKSNGSMLGGGSLLPEYRDTWARYIVKFAQAYRQAGIPLWGLTVQNEPMAKQKWESMILTAEDEARFLGEHLGPALKAAGLGGLKVIAWDHNRDLLPQRTAHILADRKARPYVWGVGYHWYETWTKGEPMHRNLAAMHEAYPDVPFLLTESTIENFDPARLQSWANAERYGGEILADLNAGSSGWVDWNMLLDMRGGPNHVGNYCFALLHAGDDGRLVTTPSYAYMGHFTRWIRPKARRVSAATSRSTLDATAFTNSDGSLAVVVLNRTAQPQRYRLQVDGGELTIEIPAHAIQTAVRAAPDPHRPNSRSARG